MHFVDRDVVVLYTLYLIKPDLILHICNLLRHWIFKVFVPAREAQDHQGIKIV